MGLIDYSASHHGKEENALASLNVIATQTFTLSGTQLDATTITPDLIPGTLHEADGIEANVASGYHAVEFLLWGQDLNGIKPGAGARPFTDFLSGDACMYGNRDEDDPARVTVTTDPQAGLLAMLTGKGTLSFGELARKRMKLGLMLNNPAEEHDCPLDYTHNSPCYDDLGIRNVYLGT